MYSEHIYLKNNIACVSWLIVLISSMGAVHPTIPPDTCQVLIIGSGVAGYAAALYAGQARVSVVQVAGAEPGGQLNRALWVDNIPGIQAAPGYTIMDALHEQVLAAGVHYQYGTVTMLQPVTTGWRATIQLPSGASHELYAPIVLLATGAHPRLLDVPDIARAWGHGLSTCALCDKGMARDKDIVIVGSGAGAAHEVIQLLPYARSITVIMRATSWKSTVPVGVLERVTSAPISILSRAVVTDIVYDPTTGDMCGIWVTQDDQERYIPAQAVFLALGHTPASELVRPWVTCAPDGAIIVDRYGYTGVPGLYAVGDVTDTPYRQAVVAAASGVVAVLHALMPEK